jgi:hypothetical protein
MKFDNKNEYNKNLFKFIETYKSFDDELFIELFSHKFGGYVDNIELEYETNDKEVINKINVLRNI